MMRNFNLHTKFCPLILLCAIISGCGEKEFNAAEYYLPSHSAVIVHGDIKNNPKEHPRSLIVERYYVTPGHWKKTLYRVEKGKIATVSLSTQYQQSEERLMVLAWNNMDNKFELSGSATYPIKSKIGADFMKTGNVSSINTSVNAAALRFDDCIIVRNKILEHAYCKGIGDTLTTEIATGKNYGIISLKFINAEDINKATHVRGKASESMESKALNMATTVALVSAQATTDPENSDLYIEAFNSASKIMGPQLKLDPISTAMFISCLSERNPEAVRTHLEYPDSLSPLGNGSEASKFETNINECHKEIIGEIKI